MLALYIILGIILFVVIILHFPVVASIDVAKEKFEFKVKFLFFSIYPLKEKKPKKMSQRKKKRLEKKLQKEKQAYKKSLEKTKQVKNQKPQALKTDDKPLEEKKSSDNIKSEKPKDNEQKLKDKFSGYKEKWEKIKPYIPIGKKALKKLIKAIKIRQLDVYIAVCNEDAYECAMNYGKVNAAVYNALALIKQFFAVSIKHIAIDCKFNSNESDYKLGCKIKSRPSTIILIAMFILVSYIHTNVKLRHNKNRK